jgi:hypothetical protein
MNALRRLLLAALICGCAAPSLPASSTSPTAPVAASASGVPSTLETRYAAAQAATTLFHVRYDQRSFGRIYASTDSAFRKTTSEAAFTAQLAALRDRTGATRSEDERDADAYEEAGDAIVTIVMETEFDSTVLTETFVWRVTSAEMALLVSYRAQ